MSNCAVDVKEKIEINTTLEPPNTFNVVYYNDDTTSVLFVVQSLIEIFNHPVEDAIDLAQAIHTHGSGQVVHGLAKELAMHLRNVVVSSARSQNYPLQVEVQKD